VLNLSISFLAAAGIQKMIVITSLVSGSCARDAEINSA
jgi:hypothetical protein